MITSLFNPTLLLDEHRCRRNIDRMATKADRLGLPLRPHFKTHQSLEIGRWFREAGVSAIAVSSLQMAEFFAADGWSDITIAFPMNVRLMGRINKLAGRIQLSLTIEEEAHLSYLKRSINHPIGIYLKADCGTQRTGIPAADHERLLDLTQRVLQQDEVSFKGLLAHAGHTYRARGRKEILAVHQKSIALLTGALDAVRKLVPEAGLSYGDTPSCSALDSFQPATELRPGNFVFYDLTQQAIGSCNKEDIAVALAAPVVARHPDRKEVIVHGGATHLSKDTLPMPEGQLCFGEAYPLEGSEWSTDRFLGYARKLSQEHGVIRLTEEAWAEVKTGDLLAILPVHSCHAAHAMGGYRTTSGVSIGMMPRAGQYI